jgi:hypothetical protein
VVTHARAQHVWLLAVAFADPSHPQAERKREERMV